MVNPPQNPNIRNCRASGGNQNRLSGRLNPPKNPIKNDPKTFTTNVPHGNTSPQRHATQPEQANRRTEPIAPPSPTSRYDFQLPIVSPFLFHLKSKPSPPSYPDFTLPPPSFSSFGNRKAAAFPGIFLKKNFLRDPSSTDR